MRAIQIVLETHGLQQILRSLDGDAEKVLDVAARNIERIAKDLAPIDTGALKNSIHVIKERPLERIIADGVEYGIYQEFGTSRMGAQPFLVPAVERVRKGFAKAWELLFQ